MDSSSDSNAGAKPADISKSKILVATAELEHRDFELAKRIEYIEKEYQLLQKVRDSLLEEEQILLERLALTKKEGGAIAEKMDKKTQNAMAMAEQAENIKLETVILERKHQDNLRREVDLDRKIALAEKTLMNTKGQISHAVEELEVGHGVFSRMDKRLSLSKQRR